MSFNIFKSLRQRCCKSKLSTILQHGRRLAHTDPSSLQKTALYDFHVKSGGKMVDFAGWSMPVLYSDQSIIQSHLHTRSNCSIFDVSHMMQSRISGKDSIKFIESLVVGDIQGLKDSAGTLSVFTNKSGGILDDLIINKTSHGYLYVVTNAGCRESDLKLFKNHLSKCKSEGMDVDFELIENALVAVQGPETAKILQEGTKADLSKLYFMENIETDLFGVKGCRITRCGYTGEDGVEISLPEEKAVELVEALLGSKKGQAKLAGLGARDTLRLEAGLCLYGNDIDTSTTPVEATLAWTIGKVRRERADFPGADVILQQLKSKPDRKRVGIITKAGPPPRAGSKIMIDNEEVGVVTSGCPSPSLKTNIAMGYVKTSLSKIGTQVSVVTRNKSFDGEISKMPFVPAKYYSVK